MIRWLNALEFACAMGSNFATPLHLGPAARAAVPCDHFDAPWPAVLAGLGSHLPVEGLELAEIWRGEPFGAPRRFFAQGKGEKEGADAEFLGDSKHPATRGPVLESQTRRDHGRLSRTKTGHLEHPAGRLCLPDFVRGRWRPHSLCCDQKAPLKRGSQFVGNLH